MTTLNEEILTPPAPLSEFLPPDNFKRYHLYGVRGSAGNSASGPVRDGDFALLEYVTVRQAGRAAVDGLVASFDSITVEWNYPQIPPPTTPDNPLFASVAYELRIIEGTFSLAKVNSIGSFGLSFPESVNAVLIGSFEGQDFLEAPQSLGTYGTLAEQEFPGSVVFETFVNLSVPADPIFLNETTVAFGSASIPDTVLESGKSYTAVIRHLVHDRQQEQGVTAPPPYGISQYAVANFRVNQSPSAKNLRVSGKVDPVLKSSDSVVFSFDIDDPDGGPDFTFRVEVGTNSGDDFSPSIWDSGIIRLDAFSRRVTSSGTGIVSESILFGGSPLSTGLDYYWRVRLNDGFSGDVLSDATAKFSLNSPPVVTSFKIDGEEALFGDQPVVGETGIQISWESSDSEGVSQTAYNLVLTDIRGSDVIVDTGAIVSKAESVTIPSLNASREFQVSLSIRDDLEFGRPSLVIFRTNAQPSVQSVGIDGRTNPPDVSGATPTISWEFLDGDGDTQSSYRIQVASDVDFTDLVWDTGNVAGAASSVVYGSTGSPTVAPEALVHGVLYHVRISASDGKSDSEFATAFFSINTAPGNPTLISPTSGAFDGTLTVQWVEASPLDADSDTVTYTLEITSQRSLGRGWELLAGPIASGTTTFDLDLDEIQAGENYGIRIIASDGFAESDPDVGGTSPRFSIKNHAPNSPVILRPKASDLVSRILSVEWIEGDPVDIDGDTVFYELQISRNSSSDDPLWEDYGIFKQGNTQAFFNVSAFEDDNDFMLRIRAVDSVGEIGEYKLSGKFSISNTLSVTDFERLNGALYLGSSDGRIFRASDTIWEVDEDWSDQRGRTPFEEFKRNNPNASVANGRLIIRPVPGSTFLLRHSDDR